MRKDYYNGTTSWVSNGGVLIEDPKALKLADFMRKTNYYWFNMMFKLLDQGVIYEQLTDQVINDINYHRVKITSEDQIGDAQDTYLLFINPDTKLVDQFLFTVMDFGLEDPLLMKVSYAQVGKLKWMSHRDYAPSDWDGNVTEDVPWVKTTSRNIKFNNGFQAVVFDPPASS